MKITTHFVLAQDHQPAKIAVDFGADRTFVPWPDDNASTYHAHLKAAREVLNRNIAAGSYPQTAPRVATITMNVDGYTFVLRDPDTHKLLVAAQNVVAAKNDKDALETAIKKLTAILAALDNDANTVSL